MQVVIEVRRQFKENPDIMTYKAKPDYERCVSLVTQAALREMRFPGLICVVTPITVGVVFRFVGELTNRPLLGAEVLASYLMFGTVTGILMALFLDTAGGAWDNAKKFIELGNFGACSIIFLSSIVSCCVVLRLFCCCHSHLPSRRSALCTNRWEELRGA